MLKRLPKSKSGRLLCVVRDEIVKTVKRKAFGNPKYNPLTDADAVHKVANLERRIKRRLEREDKKSTVQLLAVGPSRMIKVTFILPGRKRPTEKLVECKDKWSANRLIKRLYGKQTKILKNKSATNENRTTRQRTQSVQTDRVIKRKAGRNKSAA